MGPRVGHGRDGLAYVSVQQCNSTQYIPKFIHIDSSTIHHAVLVSCTSTLKQQSTTDRYLQLNPSVLEICMLRLLSWERQTMLASSVFRRRNVDNFP